MRDREKQSFPVFLSLVQIATTRRLTVHFNPPSSCVLEISVRGVKIGVKAEDAQEAKVTPSSPSQPFAPHASPSPCAHLFPICPSCLLPLQADCLVSLVPPVGK